MSVDTVARAEASRDQPQPYAELGLTATQFGIGAGMFFVGYCFCELPSNLVLYRVGARVWLSRIMTG